MCIVHHHLSMYTCYVCNFGISLSNMSFLYMIFAGRHITCVPSYRVQGIAACLGLLVSKPNNDLYRLSLQMIQPRKLTWLEHPPFEDVFPIGNGDFPMLMLLFRGVIFTWAVRIVMSSHEQPGCTFSLNDEQVSNKVGGFEHQPYSNVSKHGKTIQNCNMFHPGKLACLTQK